MRPNNEILADAKTGIALLKTPEELTTMIGTLNLEVQLDIRSLLQQLVEKRTRKERTVTIDELDGQKVEPIDLGSYKQLKITINGQPLESTEHD